ncbi:MAG TPA: hypothetical protein PLU35_10520 [Phycisphaerales bacterium]|nr:hypothetical protein [Phycisphaerales bacterium]
MMRSLGDGACARVGRPGSIGGAMQLISDADSDFLEPSRDAEETRWLVDAIAEQLWATHALCGGRLDWAGVKRDLRRIVERARSEAAAMPAGGCRAFAPRSLHAPHASRQRGGDRSIRGRARRGRPPPRQTRLP